jgi:hypothetical protein
MQGAAEKKTDRQVKKQVKRFMAIKILIHCCPTKVGLKLAVSLF